MGLFEEDSVVAQAASCVMVIMPPAELDWDWDRGLADTSLESWARGLAGAWCMIAFSDELESWGPSGS